MNTMLRWKYRQKQFAVIEKSKLNFDEYQRERNKGQPTVRSIRQEFDELALGALQVSRRPDGTLWVVDGRGRFTALEDNNDVEAFDCIVVDLRDAKEEAELFKKINVGRQSLQPFDQFKAKLVSGDPAARLLEKLSRETGYEVTRKNQPGKKSVSCVSAILARAEDWPKLVTEIFYLCTEIAAGEPIDNRVFRGLFYLEQSIVMSGGDATILTGNNRKKLIKAGQIELVESMNEAKGTKTATDSDKYMALGLIRVLNAGKHNDANKIPMGVLDVRLDKARCRSTESQVTRSNRPTGDTPIDLIFGARRKTKIEHELVS